MACSGRACPASGATPAGGRCAARRGARHPPCAVPLRSKAAEPNPMCAPALRTLACCFLQAVRAHMLVAGADATLTVTHCSRLTSLLPLHGTQQPALRGPDGAGAVSTPYALIRWAEQEQEISCACAGGIDFVVIVLFFGNNHAYFVSYTQY